MVRDALKLGFELLLIKPSYKISFIPWLLQIKGVELDCDSRF